MTRVLLAIDFRRPSLAAARWATSHLVPRAHAILSHVVPDAIGSRELIPAITGGLGGFGAMLDVASRRAMVRVGNASRALSAVARDEEASLIVFGRRADANRVQHGEPNVTERVTRLADASVLVVPEGITQAPAHVIAGIDDSPLALRVLRSAQLLARLHEAALIVVHVLSPAVGTYDRVLGKARRIVDDARRLRYPRDQVVVAQGDPAREITAAAMANESSLVVVGLRGADDAPHGSIGSVARELLARAPVPVLAVSDRLV